MPPCMTFWIRYHSTLQLAAQVEIDLAPDAAEGIHVRGQKAIYIS